MFYSYAYPAPLHFSDAPISPDAAAFSVELGEFVLPYEAVRSSSDPAAMLTEFLQSTYDVAADLANWDRLALEREPVAIAKGRGDRSPRPRVASDSRVKRQAFLPWEELPWPAR